MEEKKKNNKAIVIILGVAVIICVAACAICYKLAYDKGYKAGKLVGCSTSIIDKGLDRAKETLNTAQNIIESIKDENESKSTTNNEKQDGPVSVVYHPANDTYAVSVEGEATLDLYLLYEGKLLYKKSNTGYDGMIYTYDFEAATNGDNFNKNLVELKGLSNIKRIKGVNTISTGVAFNVLLITEDGKVYTYRAGDEKAKLLRSTMSKYQVDDIIEFGITEACDQEDWTEEDGCGSHFKIKTLDGQIVTHK